MTAKEQTIIDRALVLVDGIALGQSDHLAYDLDRLAQAVTNYDEDEA